MSLENDKPAGSLIPQFAMINWFLAFLFPIIQFHLHGKLKQHLFSPHLNFFSLSIYIKLIKLLHISSI